MKDDIEKVRSRALKNLDRIEEQFAAEKIPADTDVLQRAELSIQYLQIILNDRDLVDYFVRTGKEVLLVRRGLGRVILLENSKFYGLYISNFKMGDLSWSDTVAGIDQLQALWDRNVQRNLIGDFANLGRREITERIRKILRS